MSDPRTTVAGKQADISENLGVECFPIMDSPSIVALDPKEELADMSSPIVDLPLGWRFVG